MLIVCTCNQCNDPCATDRMVGSVHITPHKTTASHLYTNVKAHIGKSVKSSQVIDNDNQSGPPMRPGHVL